MFGQSIITQEKMNEKVVKEAAKYMIERCNYDRYTKDILKQTVDTIQTPEELLIYLLGCRCGTLNIVDFM